MCFPISREQQMRFLPGEWFVVRILMTLAALDAVLLYSKGIRIDVIGYGGVISIGGLLVAMGQYYRVGRNEPRLALSLTAAGLFVLFTIIGSIFNYMFLPTAFAPIDHILIKIDAALGFNWRAMMIWVSDYPWFGSFLYQVYFTSLQQLLVLVLVLGFRGEAQ
jgi:hypothetical protein